MRSAASQSRPRVGGLQALPLGVGVLDAGHRPRLGELEDVADRRPVVVARLREQRRVPGEHVGGRRRRGTRSPTSSVGVRRRRLDDRRAEAAQRRERVLEAVGDVGVDRRRGRCAGDSASRAPGERPRGRRAPASAAIGPRGVRHRASRASSSAQSRSVRAIGPGWSGEWLSGRMPRSDSRPRVGLIVDVPHSAEGMRSDPAVSVPVAAGVVREASAAPLPPLEPPGPRSSVPGVADLVGRRRPPRTRACAGGRAGPCRPRTAAPRRRSRLVGRQIDDRARGRERLARRRRRGP